MARVSPVTPRWVRPFVHASCEWCGSFIAPGSYRLLVGILELICCRWCAKTRRGLEPPDEPDVEHDPRAEALPVGDR